MTPAVRCIGLVKEYHTQEVVRALDFVHLDVEEGEVFGLLGPNGAGKTTLLRILTTLLSATLGRAEVGGYDVRQDEQQVRRIIGYAGQDSERSAYSRLTVRENLVYFGHALRGVPIRTARDRIDKIAAAIGFGDQLDKHFSTLSGGQKQIVIVMRALLHQPRIVFLDEPSKSLDPVTAERVQTFLVAYARQHGMTLLLTTHNMGEAEKICDRLAFINSGRLQFIGTPRDFRRSVTVYETVEVSLSGENPIVDQFRQLPGVREVAVNGTVRLYCDDGFAVLRQVVALLDRAGIKAPVGMVEPSLEDAFSIFVNGRGETDSDQ